MNNKNDLNSDSQQLHDNNPQESVVVHNDFGGPTDKLKATEAAHKQRDNVTQSQEDPAICMGPKETTILQNK